MVKIGPKEGPCGWERRPVPLDVDELHQVLNCAAARGCNQCVKCSELALEQMLRQARQKGRPVVTGLERLEADMEFVGAFGL
ncbi:conserved protein of unknown function [Magnetospirillum sp. XM-1]|uniref:hypothetical protein n=1 Tax=Magnetospirillum sp. XM-1 TaxID=1663591 RepID=UPI00073DC4FD|nr:hypothetical protein [Magnetospirillum sp. XM-1]CUW37505.1 conserved protein of unknown function [Magnetospirillum sp. XM-1]